MQESMLICATGCLIAGEIAVSPSSALGLNENYYSGSKSKDC